MATQVHEWLQNVRERILSWREQRNAAREARAALVLHKRLWMEHPTLRDVDLYEAFVRKRNGVTEAQARALLRRAEQSFAVWPEERPLIFRDVVLYVIISERLASNRPSTVSDLTGVIAKIIPTHL